MYICMSRNNGFGPIFKFENSIPNIAFPSSSSSNRRVWSSCSISNLKPSMACLCVSFSAWSSSECFCCKRSSNSYEIEIDKTCSIPTLRIFKTLHNKQMETKSRHWHTLEKKCTSITHIFLSSYYIFSFQWLMVTKIACAQNPFDSQLEKRKKSIHGYIYNSKQCNMVQIHRWV